MHKMPIMRPHVMYHILVRNKVKVYLRFLMKKSARNSLGVCSVNSAVSTCAEAEVEEGKTKTKTKTRRRRRRTFPSGRGKQRGQI